MKEKTSLLHLAVKQFNYYIYQNSIYSLIYIVYYQNSIYSLIYIVYYKLDILAQKKL